MENLTDFLNSTSSPETSTLTRVITTAYTDSKEYRTRRDLAVNISNGIAGLLIFLFNFIMILMYYIRVQTRKHISFMMLQVFIFCMIQGLEVGTVFVLHRVFRYKMPIWYCVIGDIFMQYLDDYVLMLLPLLAIERLINLIYPFLSRKRSRRWAITSTIVAMFITMFTSIIPLIPQIGIPESTRLGHDHKGVARRRSRFYHYFSCQEHLNKRNAATPIIMLILQISCLVIVVGVYIKMYSIAKQRLTKFSGLTEHKKKKLRKAAISVMLVAIVFFLTTWPFGLVQTIRSMCTADYVNPKSKFCKNIGLELRFILGIVSHLGFLAAPLLFTLFNPKLRNALGEFLCCRKKRYNSSKGNSSSSTNREASSQRPFKPALETISEGTRTPSPVAEEDMPYLGPTSESSE